MEFQWKLKGKMCTLVESKAISRKEELIDQGGDEADCNDATPALTYMIEINIIIQATK